MPYRFRFALPLPTSYREDKALQTQKRTRSVSSYLRWIGSDGRYGLKQTGKPRALELSHFSDVLNELRTLPDNGCVWSGLTAAHPVHARVVCQPYWTLIARPGSYSASEDDLTLHASADVFSLSTTNSSKSAYFWLRKNSLYLDDIKYGETSVNKGETGLTWSGMNILHSAISSGSTRTYESHIYAGICSPS